MRRVDVLEDALARCRNQDMRTAEVYEALDFLAARTRQKWPFEQFRKALDDAGTEGSQPEARWQMLNASLNGIKLALEVKG